MYITNNHGNDPQIEFAICSTDTVGIFDNPVKMVVLFDKGDTISASQRWEQVKVPEFPDGIFYISYYFNCEAKRALQPNSQDRSGNLFLNKGAIDKYIGVRRKSGDTYLYGWIKCNLANYDNLQLPECAFAEKK